MRFLKLITLTALIVALSGTAWALSLSPGPQEAKMNDFTSIYRAPGVPDPITGVPFPGSIPIRPGQTLDPVPNPAPGSFIPVVPGDENRAIFNVTTITPDVGGTPGPDFVGSPTGDIFPWDEQLSGMFYDLTPVAATPLAGAAIIEYGALGRNPLPAAVADPRVGGVIELYLESGPGMSNFNEMAADPWGLGYNGPEAWDEADSLGVNVATNYAGRDTFPTINTGGETLFLQLVFIPYPGAGLGAATAGTLVRETVTIGGDERGFGAGFAMIVGGSYASNLVKGARNASYASSGFAVPAGLSADFEIRFNIDPSETQAPPWGAVSDDPVKFGVIPEPVTMLGVFLAVSSLGGYLRRRRIG